MTTDDAGLTINDNNNVENNPVSQLQTMLLAYKAAQMKLTKSLKRADERLQWYENDKVGPRPDFATESDDEEASENEVVQSDLEILCDLLLKETERSGRLEHDYHSVLGVSNQWKGRAQHFENKMNEFKSELDQERKTHEETKRTRDALAKKNGEFEAQLEATKNEMKYYDQLKTSFDQLKRDKGQDSGRVEAERKKAYKNLKLVKDLLAKTKTEKTELKRLMVSQDQIHKNQLESVRRQLVAKIDSAKSNHRREIEVRCKAVEQRTKLAEMKKFQEDLETQKAAFDKRESEKDKEISLLNEEMSANQKEFAETVSEKFRVAKELSNKEKTYKTEIESLNGKIVELNGIIGQKTETETVLVEQQKSVLCQKEEEISRLMADLAKVTGNLEKVEKESVQKVTNLECERNSLREKLAALTAEVGQNETQRLNEHDFDNILTQIRSRMDNVILAVAQQKYKKGKR